MEHYDNKEEIIKVEKDAEVNGKTVKITKTSNYGEFPSTVVENVISTLRHLRKEDENAKPVPEPPAPTESEVKESSSAVEEESKTDT